MQACHSTAKWCPFGNALAGYPDQRRHFSPPQHNYVSKHMPSKSKPQARLMAAAAHDPAFAKRIGIPQRVAREFNQADKSSGILRKKRSSKRK
jgi:hypothetical protein